jgi:predicted  nucleic acid-binding Zn-ribbon protein
MPNLCLGFDLAALVIAMSDRDDIAGLQPHIAALRERAAQARRLASEVEDKLAREGLTQHAEEFERRAEELEARLKYRGTEAVGRQARWRRLISRA